MNDKPSIVEKILTAPSREEQDEEQSNEYKAFGISATQDRQIRIDIRDRKGNSWFYSYSYITRIQCTGNQLISLIATDSIVTLEGENLNPLKRYFQNEMIVYVQEFNSQHWNKPEPGNPIINKIEIWEASTINIEE